MFYKLKPNYIILINTVNKYFLLTLLKHDFNTTDSKKEKYIFSDAFTNITNSSDN